MSSMNHLIIFFFSSILLVQQAPYKIKQVNRKFPVTLQLCIFLLFSRNMPPNSLLLQLDETTIDLCLFLVTRATFRSLLLYFVLWKMATLTCLSLTAVKGFCNHSKKGLHSNDSNKLASEK